MECALEKRGKGGSGNWRWDSTVAVAVAAVVAKAFREEEAVSDKAPAR
jgi:hypothetical protein